MFCACISLCMIACMSLGAVEGNREGRSSTGYSEPSPMMRGSWESARAAKSATSKHEIDEKTVNANHACKGSLISKPELDQRTLRFERMQRGEMHQKVMLSYLPNYPSPAPRLSSSAPPADSSAAALVRPSSAPGTTWCAHRTPPGAACHGTC
jgi:hypothetical protein